MRLAGRSHARGYRMPTGATQSRNLTWTNLNQVRFVFSENVQNSLDISDFIVTGVGGVRADNTNGSIPFVTGVSYLNNVATVSLNQDLDPGTYKIRIVSSGVIDASGNSLYGEWVNDISTQSGNSVPGGDFAYRINVLPGDLNNDGLVDSLDVQLISALTFNVGAANYNMFNDVDGNGSLGIADRTAISRRVGSRRVP